MLKHNTYFQGQVQSIGFSRVGRAQSVGVVDGGEHTFGTEAAERMTVIAGEFFAQLPGDETWRFYPAGTSFEIPAKSSFNVRCSSPTAYWCEYL